MSERHWPHDISDEELHTVFTGEHSEKGLSEPPYQYDRTEGDEHTSRLDVAALHEQSFIEYIRQRLSEKEKHLYQELSRIRKFNPRENIVYDK